MVSQIYKVYKTGRKFGRAVLSLNEKQKLMKSASRANQMYSAKEVKYHDLLFTTTGLDSTVSDVANCFHLSGILAGDEHSEREGERIKPLHIGIRMTVRPSDLNRNGYLRVCLVRDNNVNDSLNGIMSYNYLFQSDIRGFRNVENTKRFSILVDKTYTFVDDGTGASNDKFIELKYKLPKSAEIDYSSAGATTAHKGALYLIMYAESHQSNTTSSPWLVTGQSRLTFTEF